MTPFRTTLFLSALTLLTVASTSAQEAQPTAEHQRLAAQVGTWDAAMEFLTPDGGKDTAKATSVRKQPMGPFWVIDNFQGTVFGAPFRGLGTTGYDPTKKKYVGTWVDSMTPSLLVLEGSFDASGKVLTMTGTAPGPDGKPATHRTVTTVVDADKHVFEMFLKPAEGDEVKVMTITYTRRKQAGDRVRGGR